MNAQRYWHEIMQPHIVPIVRNDDIFFLQYDARPNATILIITFLQTNNITVNRSKWPGKSQVLNPMKHLWNELDRRVRQRQPSTTCASVSRRVDQHYPATDKKLEIINRDTLSGCYWCQLWAGKMLNICDLECWKCRKHMLKWSFITLWHVYFLSINYLIYLSSCLPKYELTYPQISTNIQHRKQDFCLA